MNSNLVSSATKLTLDKFIDCLVNSNYQCLIKSGKATDEQLHKAWDKVYDEYLSILKNKDQSYVFELQKDIQLLEFKIQQINLCVSYLMIERNEEVIEELKKITVVAGKLDKSSPEQYLKDIEIIISNAQRLVVEHADKVKELNDLVKDDTFEQITVESFDAIIMKVSKFMSFKIDKKTTTVSEFANALYDFNKHLERQYAEQTASI